MEKYGFVYLWRDKKHSRYYIGSHWGTIEDGYICSSSWMKQAYKKRPDDFKRRIVKIIFSSRKDLLLEETRWIGMIKDHEIGKKYYNLNKGRIGHWTAEETSKTVRQKMSDTLKRKHKEDPRFRARYLESMAKKNKNWYTHEIAEKKRQSMIKTMAEKYPDRYIAAKRGSEDHFKKLSEASKKMWQREGHRENVATKISDGMKGKQLRLGQKNSSEHNEKISQSNIGKTHSEESKTKMSRSRTGKKQSQETIEKRRNSLTGRTRTQKERDAISKGKRGKPLSENAHICIKKLMKTVSIDDIRFESISDAARKTGICVQTIINRCNSKSNKFQNYRFL